MKRRETTLFLQSHAFQSEWCHILGGPILNACCQADPAFLGEKYGAVNVDSDDREIDTQTIYKDEVKNFIQCDVRALPFADHSFRTSVLGETIEHCTTDYAYDALKEICRVTSDYIIITYPYDDRPKEEQHKPEHLVEYAPGCTSWHQTLWTRETLEQLFKSLKLRVIAQRDLTYYFTKTVPGIGMVLRKGVWV